MPISKSSRSKIKVCRARLVLSLTIAGRLLTEIWLAPAAKAIPPELNETVDIRPIDFDQIQASGAGGDVDNREVEPNSVDGPIWVSPGDKVMTSLQSPGELTGKLGTCVLHYTIREEHERNCKKYVQFHRRERPICFTSNLSIGTSIRSQLELESFANPNSPIRREIRELGNDPLIVPIGGKATVRFTFDESEVVFHERNTLTQAERREYVDPIVRQLQSRPNVTVGEITNIRVIPGTVTELRARLAVERTAK